MTSNGRSGEVDADFDNVKVLLLPENIARVASDWIFFFFADKTLQTE